MRIGKIESILEKLEYLDYLSNAIEIIIKDKNYFGIFVDERLKDKDKKRLIKIFNNIEIWELRHKDISYNEESQIESIGKNILVNYLGALILDKDELDIKEETEVEDHTYIDDITEWDDYYDI